MCIEIHVISGIQSFSEVERLWKKLPVDVNIPPCIDLYEIKEFYELLIKLKNDNSNQYFEPIILAIYRKKILVSLWPLMKCKKKKYPGLWIKTIVFLGQNYSKKICDVIQTDLTSDEVKYIFDFVKSKFEYHYLCFANLSPLSILVRFLPESTYLYTTQICIPLNFTYDKLKKEIYSRRLRNNLRNYYNFIGKRGDQFSYGIIREKDQIHQHYDSIKRITKVKSLKLGFSSVFENDIIGKWYVSTIINNPEPFMSYYKYHGNLLSYMIGYKKGGEVYLVEGGYNREISFDKSISFGALAIDQVVSEYANKANRLNLGFGLNPYKLSFSKQYEEIMMLILPGRGLLSKALYSNFLRKVKKNQKKFANNINSVHSVSRKE